MQTDCTTTMLMARVTLYFILPVLIENQNFQHSIKCSFPPKITNVLLILIFGDPCFAKATQGKPVILLAKYKLFYKIPEVKPSGVLYQHLDYHRSRFVAKWAYGIAAAGKFIKQPQDRQDAHD